MKWYYSWSCGLLKGLLALSILLLSAAPRSWSTEPDETFDAPQISTNAAAVVRLVQANIDKGVVLAYIDSIQTPFDLSADAVIYLNDLGIDSAITTAMLQRDVTLASVQLPSAPTAVAQSPAFSVPQVTNTTVIQTIYVTNPPPQVAYFQDTLEPYGVWIDLDGLGWCWQPAIVRSDRSWRPYWSGGRWIYSNLGWYWQSDYSWGWTVFHYGRWHRHPRAGWVWFPDLAWAPAWVSWRYSDSYCGWAPLPPGAHFVVGQGFWFHDIRVGLNFDFHLAWDLFTFVEVKHMRERYPHHHGVSDDRARDAFARTTPINNHTLGPNHRLINNGIPPERVAAASRKEVPKVTIRDIPVSPRRAIRPDQLEKAGSSTILYRGEVKPGEITRPLRAQKMIEPIAAPRPRVPDTPSTRLEVSAQVAPAFPIRPAESQPKPSAPITTRLGEISRPAAIPTAPPSRRVIPRESPATSTPQTPPVSVQPVPRGTTTTVPGIRAAPSIAPPERLESPRGREQRLSTGPNIRQFPVRPPPGAPARGTPVGTPGGRTSQEKKR